MNGRATKLPKGAYHPDSDEHFVTNDKNNLIVPKVNQLLRAAVMINPQPKAYETNTNGCENKHDIAKSILTELKEHDENHIDEISIREGSSNPIINKEIKDNVTDLFESFKQEKETVKKEVEEKYEELYEDFKTQVKNANAAETFTMQSIPQVLNQPNDENEYAVGAVRIIDPRMIRVKNKNVHIQIVGNNSELKERANEITGFIEENGGEIIGIGEYNSSGSSADVIIGDVSTVNTVTREKVNTINWTQFERLKREVERYSVPYEYIVGKNELNGININFGYETPVDTLAVIYSTSQSDTINVYPLLPWCGVLMCTCYSKHELESGVRTLCEHEILAIRKQAANDIQENRHISLPSRFTRFVHPDEYKQVQNEILQSND